MPPRSCSPLRQGRFYAAVVNGQALVLFFVDRSDDGTEFVIGGGPNQLSRQEAIGLARSLTTSVRVVS